MKIIFTHGYFLSEDPKEQKIMRPYPPLGILYISAYLESKGFPNDIFDTTFSDINSLQSYLLKERPDVLGIYTNLMTKLNVLRLIKFVRSCDSLRHTRIVLGGPEVRNHKEKFIEYGADVIIFGEGEETMLELVSTWKKNLFEDDLEEINGITFRKNRSIVINPERTLIKTINELPFPAREKINLQLYFDAWKSRHGFSMININTMRGCPYSCKWCSRAVYGGSYRRRDAKLVVDEIEWLQKTYQFDMLWFVDDVFTINHRWLREFAVEIAARNINVRYEIISRADRVNEEVLQLLKASGCFRVWIGAESGSQKIIDAMDRRVEVKQVREAIRQVKLYGMQAGTFIMLGYPGEDEKDIKETLHHLKYSAPDQFTITVAYPIKGTPLYSEVEPKFIEPLPWETSTDRDIDFQRRYKRKYYDHAINWINNEMQYQREKGLISKLRAWKARGNMILARLF